MQVKGALSQEELDSRIADHQTWLKDPSKGEKFQVAGDFIGLTLTGNLSHAVMFGCDFTFTTWDNVRLDNAVIENCNFSDAKMQSVSVAPGNTATLKDCDFKRTTLNSMQLHDCMLADLTFQDATIVNLSLLRCRSFDLSFANSTWKYGGFLGGEAERVNLTGTTIDNFFLKDCRILNLTAPELDFSKIENAEGAELILGNFDGADLTNIRPGTAGNGVEMKMKSLARSRFVGAKMTGSSFRDVEVYGCTFRGAMLSDASFSGPSLDGCDFSSVTAAPFYIENCSAYRAEFDNARGGNWDVINCGLSRADFSGSDLKYSSFVDCDLTGSSFVAAHIETITFGGCDLDGATWVDGRRCQVGSFGKCKL